MKGQMEMLGLAMVVVFIVMGLMIFALLSTTNTNTPAREIEEAALFAKALQTAMLETSVPECSSNLQGAITRCMQTGSCGTSNACIVAHDAWETMLDRSLGDNDTDFLIRHSAKLHLSDGVPITNGVVTFLHEPEPTLCSDDSNSLAAPKQPIPYGGSTLYFTIRLC